MQNRRFSKLISLCTAFALLIVTAVAFLSDFAGKVNGADPIINDATVQAYEQRLREIAREQDALKATLAKARTNEASAKEIKAQLDRQISLSIDKIEYTNKLLDELSANIEKKNDEIAEKTADIDEQYENLKTLLRITYEEGDVSYLELIMGAESLYDFLVRTERVSSIISYNTRTMKQYQEEKATLEDEKNALDSLMASQAAYKISLEEEEEELRKQYSENETYLAGIQWSEAKYQQQILENQKLEQQLDKELEAYIKEQQAKLNAAYYGGEFIWPVDAAKWKYISSPFGWRDLWGVRDFHLGIDIPCSTGSSVWASNGGTVIQATYHYSYGYYVVIDHGGGLSTLYAHNSKLLVSVGQKVEQKQVIALAGSTGNSSGPHCHFEVRKNGERQQPLDYVTQPK